MNRPKDLLQRLNPLPMLIAEKLNNKLTVHQRALRLMGNRFELSVVGDDANVAQAHIDSAIAEISRIEKLLTTFSDDSQTNEINRNAGIKPVKVPEIE